MEYLLVLGTAFGLGAFHALEPGHGKTVIAAYLVGSRGTAWEAALLGLVVAITHTFSVIALGVVSMFALSAWTDLELSKVIGVASGIAIILVGLWMFATRWRDLHAHRSENDHHDHHHGEENHGHHHDHYPTLNPGQERVGLLQILTLGISGGLIPCPAALVVLLASINSGQIASGLSYLLVFSLGVASVLMALGVFVSKATSFAGRYLDKPGIATLAPLGSAVLIIAMGVFVTWQATLL